MFRAYAAERRGKPVLLLVAVLFALGLLKYASTTRGYYTRGVGGKNFADPDHSMMVSLPVEPRADLALGDAIDAYFDAELDRYLIFGTVATSRNVGLDVLEHSCKAHGIPLNIAGLGLKFDGLGMKVRLLKGFLTHLKDQLPPSVWQRLIFSFIDAYDVVMLASPKRFLHTMAEAYGLEHVIFQAESNCWPVWELAHAYPPTTTTPSNVPWRYLNSGTYVGPVERVLALFDGSFRDSLDDQLYFVLRYIVGSYHIKLDEECRLFQSMWDSEPYLFAEPRSPEETARPARDVVGLGHRLRNTLTLSEPCLLHGNGPKAPFFRTVRRIWPALTVNYTKAALHKFAVTEEDVGVLPAHASDSELARRRHDELSRPCRAVTSTFRSANGTCFAQSCVTSSSILEATLSVHAVPSSQCD